MNRLYRSPDDRVLAGVAGGMAQAWDLDPALVRVGWAFLILITGGLFLLLYIVMAVIVPLRPVDSAMWGNAGLDSPTPPPGPGGDPLNAPPAGPSPAGTPFGPPPPPSSYGYSRRHRRDGTGALVFGMILIAVGAYFLFRQFLPALDFDFVWPLIVIGGGLLLVVAAFGRSGHAA